MNETISTLVNEWTRNPRFRLGIWAILIILLTYLLLTLSDQKKSVRSDYQLTEGRLERLELLVRQKEWAARAHAVRTSIVQMEARFWKAGARGMAQAKIQVWIDNLLKKKGISDTRTQVDPAREIKVYNDLWQVAVRVDGAFEPRKMAELLHAIETHPKIITIEQLDIMNHKRPHFTLVFKAWFQISSG